MTKDETRDNRLSVANQIIKEIASHGRRFLSMNSDSKAPEPSARTSYFEISNGRLWYIDKWRGSRIYVHNECPARRGWGRKFSDGGTLLSLLRNLRDFIVHGDLIKIGHFGPFPDWICGGDPWGYGDDMPLLRAKVEALLRMS